MNHQKIKIIRILIGIFVGSTVAIAVNRENTFLAFAGVLIGMLFLFFVKKKNKALLYDERIKSIAGDAARFTYVITTIVFAFLSLMFLISSKRIDSPFVEALGTIFSYTALFNMAIFSISFRYFNQKY